uniref:Uncharacterized protein n=1 Tax=Heterorhabditis bacteriophora TaxID=37862 RepID=A0A1I7X7X0_HETBA
MAQRRKCEFTRQAASLPYPLSSEAQSSFKLFLLFGIEEHLHLSRTKDAFPLSTAYVRGTANVMLPLINLARASKEGQRRY